MATKSAVGSAAWVAAEKENVLQLLEQEKEEVVYPAQHEMEWLNEHMADIFQKSSIDVANVFKTPGKLRGKTPRTARKRMVEERVPLSNVFSTIPVQKSSPNKIKASQFVIAKDGEESQPPLKSQTDSGYHGSSQVDEPSQKTPELPSRSPLRTIKSPITEVKEIEDEMQTTEGSFHSAKENQTVKLGEPQTNTSAPIMVAPKGSETRDVKHPHFEDIGSPSDESTPDRPLVRKKSSMNFASLPAREPLKNSIGAAMSRSSHGPVARDSQRISARSTSAAAQYPDSDFEMSDDESNIEILGVDESQLEFQAAKQYSKASTQRLHERIDALGKIPPARPSKSIPTAASLAALSKPVTESKTATVEIDDDQNKDEDDWIKPLKEDKDIAEEAEPADGDVEMDVRAPELIAYEQRMQQFDSSPQRPVYGHMKAASTVTLASPNKISMAPPPSPAKSISGSHPVLESTTPHGSPSRFVDGPISASKSKLASIMKTAKGLFTSSASVSAAAKLETLTTKSKEDMPGMFPSINPLDKPLPESPPKETRRTRSSSERDKEEKQKQEQAEARQKMNEQLEKVRELEKQKATQQHDSPPKRENNDRQAASTSKVSRPIKTGRDISKTKPQPVSIKVGTLSHRMNPTQETLQGEPKRPGLIKKSSTASLQQGSSNIALKASVSSSAPKPRALLAAERKKEQDEREAQRKLEQKREIERKRAAQQEEARRHEQEQRAEAEKKERERIAAERTKRQAQQQAIEKKRQEAVRKAEQQRENRAANDPASSRPPSRLGQQTITRPLINHQLPTNPAKPAKRPIEEENARPQPARFGAASQQTDSKRRRTDEENPIDPPARPTMSGAPIRQSQLGKKPSIFNHSTYQQVSTQPHLGQFPQPPRNPQQMAQYATSKIPFAEPSNGGLTKTPLSAYQHKTIQAVKSSPQYQNGESIHLPDIPTDSEDESDDESNAFPIPDWATPGHLIDQLMRQEGMDGDAVFGPIAPLKLEEIFAKGNKDRLKKLRDRTSSANWAISGDGLTLEEVRADREQRERMRIQGGWQYGN